MFSKEEFQTWAKENVVLFASIMTKIDGRQDDALLRDYGFGGFPSMAMLDGDGEAITKKVERELPAMKETFAKCNAFLKTKAKVDAGEEVDAAKWFMMRLTLGQLSVAEAKEQGGDLELNEAQKVEFDQAVLALELDDLMKNYRKVGAEATANAVYDMFKAGRVPAAGSSSETFFMSMLGSAADKKNDGDAYLVAGPFLLKQAQNMLKRIEGMREGYKGDPKRLETAAEQFKKQVADIEAKLESYKKT
ncbi:MAG: hypothetical protein KDC95_03875 [Planctomycetes bacterium]|nr:hypothetical protein [Planctomycetota bacterium]